MNNVTQSAKKMLLDALRLSRQPQETQVETGQSLHAMTAIRSSIDQAYGGLLTKLESSGLVTLVQTQEEAIDVAARARVALDGSTLEDARDMLELSVRNSTQGDSRGLQSLGHFYSALSRSIDLLTTKSAPVSGWKDVIKGMVNKGQVKADEVQWSGVEDWLDLQNGRVSKESLTGYLDANGVQVDGVILGGNNDVTEIIRNGPEEYDILSNEGVILERGFLSRQSAQEYIDDQIKETKYGDYVLPGGENYREVLLILPSRKKMAQGWFVRLNQEKFYKGYNAYELIKPDGIIALTARTEDIAISLYFTNYVRGKDYKSNHWDQSNVLAHFRLNDRKDSEGGRVLFVEELQSDWGAAFKKEVGSLNKSNFEELDEDQARVQALFSSENGEKKPSVSNAPFIGKTEGWLNLSLKRIISLAVSEGYDSVAFVNGTQSSDRYDMSKQVDMLSMDAVYPSGYNITAWREDKEVVSKKVESQSEAADVVGKEAAQKLFSRLKPNEQHVELTGLELKVGGEGMKVFYDEIVPNAINALLKKLGGEKMGFINLGEADWGVFDRADNPLETGFGSKQKAEEVSKDYPGSIIRNDGGDDQSGFKITPEMRSKVSNGLPLFSRLVVQTEFDKWFGNSQTIDDKGRPLVVYHGTNSVFSEFDADRSGENRSVDKRGIFFTNDVNTAEYFAAPDDQGYSEEDQWSQANIIPVYLSLKNPVTMDDVLKHFGWTLDDYYECEGDPVHTGEFYDLFRPEILELADKKGADGIFLSLDGFVQAVAFSPTQIKSAIGNNGDFDPTKPDICYSRSNRPDQAAQGFYDPQTGKSFLIADHLTPHTAAGVFMHEVGIHMASSPEMQPVFDQARKLVQEGSGLFLTKVRNKIKAAGERSGEESAAYLVEAYEQDRLNSPPSVKQWFTDLVSMVRAWAFKHGHFIEASDLTASDIAAVARGNARGLAHADRLQKDIVFEKIELEPTVCNLHRDCLSPQLN